MRKSIEIGNTKVVADTIGGKILSWTYKGDDIIAPFRVKHDKKERGGIFACLPFFGPAPEEMPNIPQHGWLRHQELDMECQSIDENGDVILTFKGLNITTREYPWRLEYKIRYRLTETVMRIYLECKMIEVIGESLHMPAKVQLALHPYFAMSKKTGGASIIHARSNLEFSSEAYFMDSRTLFANTPAGTIRVSTTCSKICLWSDAPIINEERGTKKYVCIEPVLTIPEDGDKYHYIYPGESVSIAMDIKLGID